MTEQLGSYELVRRIVTGDTADLYLGRRHGAAGFTRECVVKRLHPQLAADDAAVHSFLFEARLTATLQHRNIAQVLDLGRIGGAYYAALELIDGPDLERALPRVDAKDPLRPDLAAWIVARAADGVHFAHEFRDPLSDEPLELVHGHLSPRSIVISRQGDVKLHGFGRLGSGRAHNRPGYAAPEFVNGAVVDRRADVYALGLLLRALTAHDSDPGLEAIIGKATADDPRDRYEHAGHLATALMRWLIMAGQPDCTAALGQWVAANLDDLCPSFSDTKPAGKRGKRRRRRETLELDGREITSEIFESSQHAIPRHNLPDGKPPRLYGRTAELGRVADHLDAGARAVALGGVAGIGKSRIARSIARSHVDAGGSAWVVDLSDVATAEAAAGRVANALGVGMSGNTTKDAAIAHIGRALARAPLPLLVLDGVDLLVDDAPGVIPPLLSECPPLRMLITTRRRVQVDGVVSVVVQPLSIPSEPRKAARSDAVRFFVSRVRRVRKDYRPKRSEVTTIVGILRRLDGIPLAIELAAAVMADCTARQLLQRLETPSEVLEVTGRSSRARMGKRARTLRDAIALSWTQLSDSERENLQQLVVFRGGFDAEAVGAVLGEGVDASAVIDGLVAHSMVREVDETQRWGGDKARNAASSPRRPRFVMFESVRAFVYEQPVDPEARTLTLQRHGRYYVEEGERNASLVTTHDGPPAVAWLMDDRDNLAAVHRRALRGKGEAEGGAETALRICLLLSRVMILRGPKATLMAMYDDAIDALNGLSTTDVAQMDQTLLARSLARYAEYQALGGNARDGEKYAKRATQIARATGDIGAIAAAHYGRGVCYRLSGRTEQAIAATTRARSLAQRVEDIALEAEALNITGSVYYDMCERNVAAKCFVAAQAAARHVGHGELVAQLTCNLGCVCVERGNTDRALAYFHEALGQARTEGDIRLEGSIHLYMAVAAQERGDMGLSRMHFQRSIDLLDKVGFRHRKVYVEGLRAWFFLECGERRDLARVKETFERIVDHFVDKGDWRWRSMFLATLALIASRTGDDRRAKVLLDESRRLADGQHDPAAGGVYEVFAAGVELIQADSAAKPATTQRLRKSAAHRLDSVRLPRDGHTMGGGTKPPLTEMCCEVRTALRIVEAMGLTPA